MLHNGVVYTKFDALIPSRGNPTKSFTLVEQIIDRRSFSLQNPLNILVCFIQLIYTSSG